jgi:hypothetical protein
MTLIVAQQKNGVIAVVSDTGITEHERSLGYDRQIPKICIVTPDLAVAFAGSSDLGIRYLENFPPMLNFPYKTTVEYLLRCHRDADESVDFLALFNKPVPKIVAVRNGRIFPPAPVEWIGDKLAFEAFQKYRRSRAGASAMEDLGIMTTQTSEAYANNVTFDLLGTLRRVMLDPQITSVFGFGVAVNNVDGFFSYRSYAFILKQREISLALPMNLLREMAPELVELRDFAVSCFVSDPSGAVQAIALHFPQGMLTFMYFASRGRPLAQVRIVASKNIKEFMTETTAELGISWIGRVVLRRLPPPEYGIPINEWRGAWFPRGKSRGA